MYYCRDCKKVVKDGNVCTCGKQLTPKDEIIFCPSCNKMYYKPSKNFVCKHCNTLVEVVPKVKETKNIDISTAFREDETDTLYANMFLNDKNTNDAENKKKEIDDEISSLLNSNNNQSNSNMQNETRQFNHNVANNNTANDNKKEESSNNSSNNSADLDSDIDVSQFETVGGDNVENQDGKAGKKQKKVKEKKQKGGSAGGDVKVKEKMPTVNKLALIAIALIFVLTLVCIFYMFVIPYLTPSYKANWDTYVKSINEYHRVIGEDKSVTTADFDVVKKTDNEVVAKIVIEFKTYNAETKKYDNDIKKIEVNFIKKKGEFVIKGDPIKAFI